MMLLLVALLAAGIALTDEPKPELGATTIAQWRNGCRGAVALAFDDALWSHVDYVIPLLAKRDLVGSFWLNPGTNRYGYGVETWEGEAQELGMELCSHTMNHTGASSLKEAEYEIGECTRILRSLRPAGSCKTMLFLRGGGTTWKITDRQMAGLIEKYDLLRGRGGGIQHGGEDKTGAELVGYVKQAEADGRFHCIAFHGVGPQAEWLKASASAFEKLINYLDEARDRVWTGTCGEVHQYEREYRSAKAKALSAAKKRVTISLSCDEDPAYYCAPLTLQTHVPKSWKRCLVTQGKDQAVRPVRNGIVRFAARPNQGAIHLEPTKKKLSRPATLRPKEYARRSPSFKGKKLFAVGRIPAGETVSRIIPSSGREVWLEFSFKMSKDFRLPELADDGDNALVLLSLTDEKGRHLAAVHVYRKGPELALYALIQDDLDSHGIPGWPNTPAGHLTLERGRNYTVILHTKEGRRDGGAELWLNGRLRCSFLRRNTAGRKVKSMEAGTVSAPPSMTGSVTLSALTLSGR